MYRLLYSSVAVVSLTEEEMEAIFAISRSNNEADGLTGILLHLTAADSSEAAFVQVLEGEREAIERTLARIKADDLHRDLRVLAGGPIDQRIFPAWSVRRQEVPLAQLRSVLARESDALANLQLADPTF